MCLLTWAIRYGMLDEISRNALTAIEQCDSHVDNKIKNPILLCILEV